MNKIKTIIISVLGACNVLVTVATPIILASLWISVSGLNDWGSYLFFGVGLLASAFRGIKFWMKGEENLLSSLIDKIKGK